MTISAILQSRLRDAEWDAEIARETGDTPARLGDSEWITALETEM